jgi:glutamate/tyrosine decarboxylase-like PLP-dependent enzyme
MTSSSALTVMSPTTAALGRDGVAALVERTCRLARRFAQGMREAGFSVLNDVVLNQVVVDFGNAARTESVITAIQREGMGHHRRRRR